MCQGTDDGEETVPRSAMHGLVAKRTFDLIFAAFGLVFLSPLLVLIACWIKLDSKGPVFFRQERVGRYGRPFRIHKFRTMRANLESQGPFITPAGDRRVTTAGRFLRRYKLDELPQLIDVFKGEMSVVGARPEVPRYVTHYPPCAKAAILTLRPGITDPASIVFRHEEDILAGAEDPEREYIEKILPAKLHYYEDYVRRRSLWYDVVLIARTLRAIIA